MKAHPLSPALPLGVALLALAFASRLSAADARFDLPGPFDVEAQDTLALATQPGWVAVQESMAGTPPQPVISIVSADGDQILLIPLKETALREWVATRDQFIALDADRKPLQKTSLTGPAANGSYCILPGTAHPQAMTRIMGDLSTSNLSLSFNATFANTNRWPEAQLILESIRMEPDEPAPPPAPDPAPPPSGS